jgi:hypothetical protein
MLQIKVVEKIKIHFSSAENHAIYEMYSKTIYIENNIEACSQNHCCCGKAINIT